MSGMTTILPRMVVCFHLYGEECDDSTMVMHVEIDKLFILIQFLISDMFSTRFLIVSALISICMRTFLQGPYLKSLLNEIETASKNLYQG